MSNSVTSSRFLFASASIIITLAGIKLASSILVPFLLAFFVAIICSPAINFLERYKVPRGIAITLVILIITLAFLLLGGIIGTSVNGFRHALPGYEAQLASELNWMIALLGKYNLSISFNEVKEYFDPSKIMGLVTSTLSGFSSVLGNVFLLLLTVIFMLGEGKVFAKKIHLIFGSQSDAENRIVHFLNSVNQYMAIKTLISLVTGFIIGFVLWLMGVDFFILWALLAFLLNYIPNIGSIIAAVPAVILTFLQLGSVPAAFVALLFLSVNMIMGSIVEPRLMGRSLGLSTLVVFLSLIFWGWLLGMVGMLLSVPLTMILKIGLENTENGKGFAVFLSSEDEVNALEKAEKK